MFPVVLNLSVIPVLLVGQGELLERRKKQLADAGARQVSILQNKMPEDAQIAANTVVMVAGLDRTLSEAIATKARAMGKLVNVEDVNDLCDFYFTANVRRGDLLVAVSTGGASPTLARRVRDKIAAIFGEEWKARTDEIAGKRKGWKAEGKSMPEIMRATDALLAEKGWL